MTEIIMNIIAIIGLIIGIYLGYRTSFLLYEFLMMKISHGKTDEKQLNEFCVVNEIVMQRYNLGALNLFPDYIKFNDDFSINEKNEIGMFFTKMEQLGIQYIYLKPHDKNFLLYEATGFGEYGVFSANIILQQYKN